MAKKSAVARLVAPLALVLLLLTLLAGAPASAAKPPKSTTTTTSTTTTSTTTTTAPSANPYQRGPEPTAAALEKNGPYAYATFQVADSATPGFGAATIYYPTTTVDGTFGGVAVSPGFTEKQSAVSWLGPRLSSHGFVVITFDTNSSMDYPDQRATQLLAALDYLVGSSSVRDRVDGSRLAVMGHSMGGGGAIEASSRRTTLKASVPLTPWHGTKNWPGVVTPTGIIGAQNDTVAPVGTHAVPLYEGLTKAREKAYLELAGAGHSVTNSDNPLTSRFSLSWLKRFVDDDTRYDQFLCPPPSTGGSTGISQYRATCPH